MGWDHHGGLPNAIRGQCNDTDRATAGLIIDLKQRGLLEDTLIVWGGEFGRTIYSQGGITENNYGRDHHPRCYSIFLAGAGIKKGLTYGVTDDFCYNIVENPVSVYDLNATILHQLGINHESLTFKFQGLNAKLTGVEPAKIIKDILA
jgi:arylsulfatase A-like enzyme